ncbi:hypothetical protein FHS78_001238 [Parvibaculum indicum]|uniref:hypothetical protein n=1 Tax=Parvibaculum indicum TaxID=562969 RepID=UPI001420363A|nr:hypothetical protein [Parvibaculum indicum]NIJ40957.1 hypothetical protein [Parvibaculum indicum]
MPRNKIDFNEARDLVLLVLYEVFSSENGRFKEDIDIVRRIKKHNWNTIDITIRDLIKEELIEEGKIDSSFRRLTGSVSRVLGVDATVSGYAITKAGIDEVQKWTDERFDTRAKEVSRSTKTQDGIDKLPAGSQASEQAASTANSIDSSESDKSIPASNRYVSHSDNEPEIAKLRSSVSDLIETTKENRDNDFDDKEGRLGELLALELQLSQPQISVPLIEIILNDTVKYLANKFADNAVGIAANIVLHLAASLFGITL